MSEELLCSIWVFPDGATSWIGGFEIPEWKLECDLYAFTAEGENEARWAVYEFIRYNADYLHRLGPGKLNFSHPSAPHFEPAGTSS